MFVDDGEVEVKIDTCARYSIAVAERQQSGQRLQSAQPVQAVEGLGGTTLRVDGVWRFQMATAFDQHGRCITGP
ncbi:TPA: hypothetical protein N0F65_009830 [Lagenidium giganteum]|uniref:Uncharacterized protein n=1 Tax=Lagenidium giganteum TaxID=4803 RepID=A0AAV2YQM5_9STRA|nr:TPA: hypothetical protein N0F65_009830 [Lagenidium giganteum]